jgi:hypothetical protein
MCVFVSVFVCMFVCKMRARRRTGRMLCAADSALAACNVQDAGGDDDGDDIHVLLAVQTTLRRKRARLRTVLNELFARAIVVSRRGIAVHPSLPGTFGRMHYDNPTSMGELLAAVRETGMTGEKLGELAAALMECVFEPLLAGRVVPEEAPPPARHTLLLTPIKGGAGAAEGAGGGAGAGAGGGSGGGGGGAAAPTARVFEHVMRVFEFLQASVLAPDAPMVEALGTLLWEGPPDAPAGAGGGVAARIIASLDAALPGSLRELRASYGGLVRAAGALEAQLFAAGVIRGSCARRLGALEADAEGRFALKRRRIHLVFARTLISAELHNTTRVVEAEARGLGGGKTTKGDGGAGGGGGGDVAAGAATSFGGADDDSGFFRLPPCQVSTGAERLVEHVHQILVEAGYGCGGVLYHTARDAVDLYRIIVPVRFADAIGSVPRVAMLFHNDCQYIAHSLILMGFLHRRGLPPPLNTTATFLDLVPAFRELAEVAFVRELERQRRALLGMLGGVPPFGELNAERHGVAEAELKGLTRHVHTLVDAWCDILPVEVRARAVVVG